MKSPEKNLPAEAEVSNGKDPEIVVARITGSSSAITEAAAAPTQTPPSELAISAAAGAAVWANDKRVNGLYTTYHARNAWMSIAGTGWVKLTTANDSACEAMTILASHARAKGSRVDYAVDGGQVTEMYIW